MGRRWKDLKTNWMYWRFRNITRNRLRLRNWWGQHRPSRPSRPGARPYRPVMPSGTRGRGTATYLRYGRGSVRTSWITLLVMCALMTAVHMAVDTGNLGSGLKPILDTLIVVGALYYALRGV